MTAERLSDPTYRYAIERAVQLIAQSVIDVSSTVLTEKRGRIPDTYREVVVSLGSIGVLDSELDERLGALASMRNVLVCAYLDVDPQILERTVPLLMADVHEFLVAIERLLATGGQ